MKTFVVRLWSSPGEVEGHALAALRGTVEPVGSGPAEPFRDGSELLRLLLAALEAGAGDATARPTC